MADARSFPGRPYIAVSAVVVRDGKILIVRRARQPAQGYYTVPGGAVEAGEKLADAVVREVREETGLAIEPVALAGHSEVIIPAADGRTEKHFVILCFAARWIAGDLAPNEELSDARWIDPGELAGLKTTDGLAGIVAKALAQLR